MRDVQSEDAFSMIDIPESLKGRVVNRIYPFQILFIYDTHKEQNYLKHYAKRVFNGAKEDLSLFSREQEGETFIISQTYYQGSKNVFNKLRAKAREDIFNRIAMGITAYFFKKYADLIKTSISSHLELRNSHLLDKSFQKIKTLLKDNTFLADPIVWDTFYDWFRDGLTNHAVYDVANEFGQNKLEQMEQNHLNDLIYQRLAEQVSMNSSLMSHFIKTVEQYLQQWMDQAIPVLDQQDFSPIQLKKFLGIKHDHTAKPSEKTALPLSIMDGHLSVMSNAVYQSIRDSLSYHCFLCMDSRTWPTVPIQRGTVEGEIQMIPYGHGENTDQASVEASWKKARSLSDLDIDVLDALCSFFISNATHHQDIVEIKLHDLLAIRGLKAKQSGNLRRGGYEPEQIRQIMKALSKIQAIWAHFDKVVIYDKGKPIEVTLQGRPFIFLDDHQQVCDISAFDTIDSLQFTVGEMFHTILSKSARQIALFPLKALQYNPYQKQWEKRLIRYLSWRWRTQARKSDYQQPHKIGSLLQAIGKDMNMRTPSRTRERMEQALDLLQDDGLIGSWEYLDWDETLADTKGWARLWQNTRVVITPPNSIKEQYLTISKKRNKAPQANRKHFNQADSIGAQLKDYRLTSGLTITEAAAELDISPSYISTIERNKRIPSRHLSKRIQNWIQFRLL